MTETKVTYSADAEVARLTAEANELRDANETFVEIIENRDATLAELDDMLTAVREQLSTVVAENARLKRDAQLFGIAASALDAIGALVASTAAAIRAIRGD